MPMQQFPVRLDGPDDAGHDVVASEHRRLTYDNQQNNNGGIVLPTARHKLNSACINGVLLISGVAGVLTQSWGVFFVVAGILTVTSIIAGEIRLNKQNRRR